MTRGRKTVVAFLMAVAPHAAWAQPAPPAATPPAPTPVTAAPTPAQPAPTPAQPAPATPVAKDACSDFIILVAKKCAPLNEAVLKQKALAPADPAREALKAEIATLQAANQYANLCALTERPERVRTTCDFLASALPSEGLEFSPKPDEVKERERQQFANKVAMEAKSDRRTSSNKSGTFAQTEPVEAIQPITVAGGAMTLSGTRSGTKGVGNITVNPLALGSPESAVAGRLFDLSVTAPFDLEGGTSEDRRYVSVRLRANAAAPFSAAELEEAVSAWMSEEGKYADSLQGVLENAPNVQRCVDGILGGQGVTKATCGQDLGADGVAKLRKAAFEKIKKARRKADAYYFGLDARFDTGDPTGPDIVGDRGTHLLGGLAGGVRIPQGKLWDWELRGRAAGDYFRSRDPAAGSDPEPVYSFDWGAALIFSGRIRAPDKQRMAFGVGVEGRQAPDSPEADLAPTNYANLNLMAIVPAVSGGDIGLAFSIPVAESEVPRGVIVSLSTDLGILDHPQE